MTRLHPDPSPSERAYWKKNVQLVLILLTVWFVVSYGAGILFAEWLDQWRIPGTGFPLGFWFAQQGSIYVFVALIFVYVFRMNRLDSEFGVGEGPMTESGIEPGDLAASGGEDPEGEGPREVDGASEADWAPEADGGGS
ncbi:MAG: DUF4212 domain-containing protein [Gemmatimonadales bacterium]|nr:MAG: DUF4212 domain-containing protein [Gemmatimonadales bacterium]